MKKIQFMKELKEELSSLPKDEKAAALKYYEDYFDDAGTENEQEVIKELGTPHKVAEAIKKENNIQSPKESNTSTKSNPMPVWLIVLIILLALPVGIPILAGIFGVVFGIFMALFGILIGFVCAGIGIFVSGIGTSIFGLVTALSMPANGLLLLGVGLTLIGIGELCTFAIIKLYVVIIPPLARGVVNICKWPFRNRGAY
jgi:uncharacterized membrane protein